MGFMTRAACFAAAVWLGAEASGCARISDEIPGMSGAGAAGGGGRPGTSAGGNESNGAGAAGVISPNLLGSSENGACNAQGWCWQHPTPAGDLFNAISDDGRYAAGENGIVFQWPDRYLPRAGSSPLFFVQSAAAAVWAGGYGLWRNEGADWIQESTLPVSALSASPSGELWALLGGKVQHRQRGEWLEQQPGAIEARDLRLTDVIVVADDTVWALATSYTSPKGMPDGGQLTLFESKSGVWRERPSGVKDDGGGGRFLRVGANVYVHARGEAAGVYAPAEDWRLVQQLPSTGAEFGVFASPAESLLISGLDGLYTLTDQGRQKVSDIRCQALVPTGDDAALCADFSGGLTRIHPSEPFTDGPVQPLGAAWFGAVPTPVWARSDAAWGSSASDVWRAPLEHFDGLEWTSHAGDAPTGFQALQIHGSAANNVWFRGSQELLRYDGKTIQRQPFADGELAFLSAVHTLGPNDTWLVRGQPDAVKVLHFDGTDWQETLNVIAPYAYARAAFAGGGSTPLWAAIGSGLYRREGNAWQRVLTATDSALLDLAVDGDEVWVLGDGVSQLLDGALVPRGLYSAGLQNIALSENQVWHFAGAHARTLARSK